MALDVGGDLDGAVSHAVPQGGQGGSCRDLDGGVGVAQGVEGDLFGEARSRPCELEPAPKVAGVAGFGVGAEEHQFGPAHG